MNATQLLQKIYDMIGSFLSGSPSESQDPGMPGGFIGPFSQFGGLRHEALDDFRARLAAKNGPIEERLLHQHPTYLALNPSPGRFRDTEYCPETGTDEFDRLVEAFNNAYIEFAWLYTTEPEAAPYDLDATPDGEEASSIRSHRILYVPPGMTPDEAARGYVKNLETQYEHLLERPPGLSVEEWAGG